MEVLQSMDKSTYPIISDRDNIIATPMNNKASSRKKRSKANSLPMSVKFALIRQINRLNSILIKKFETTKAGSGSGSSVASKDIWIPLTTPTKVINLQFLPFYYKTLNLYFIWIFQVVVIANLNLFFQLQACKNELQKHPSFSPLSENKRYILC